MTHVQVKRKVNYFPLLDTMLTTCCFSRQISKKYEDLKRAMACVYGRKNFKIHQFIAVVFVSKCRTSTFRVFLNSPF